MPSETSPQTDEASRKKILNSNTRLPCKVFRDRIITIAITLALRYYPESTQRDCEQVEIRNNIEIQMFKILNSSNPYLCPYGKDFWFRTLKFW